MIAPALPRRIPPELLASLRAAGSKELSAAVELATGHDYYSFEPRPDNDAKQDQQSAFLNDSTSTLAICLGGTGSGKTAVSALKTARYILETPPPRPAVPFWVIGEYLDQVCKVCWVEKLSKFIPKSEILDTVWWLSKRNFPRAIILRHPVNRSAPGWVLEFKSYEQGIGSMKAESIGGYWCNEEIPYHLLTEIQGRCRDYSSPGWADFTPIECKDPEWPSTYEQCQSGEGPEGWTFYHLNTSCNHAVAPGGKETVAQWHARYIKTIPEDLREMRTIGKFAILQGAVYKEFRARTHVVEPFDIPRHWKKWRAIDFGYNDPFCCLWFALGPDNVIYVYDEHYEGQRLLSYHAKKIKEREWDDSQPWFGSTYADHDRQDRAELAAMGIATVPAYKDNIRHGIEMVATRMIPGAKGPTLKIFKDRCPNLVRELPAYKWKVGTEKQNAKDEPYDVNNHACDALRYGCASHDLRNGAKGVKGIRAIRDARRHGVHLEGRK